MTHRQIGPPHLFFHHHHERRARALVEIPLDAARAPVPSPPCGHSRHAIQCTRYRRVSTRPSGDKLTSSTVSSGVLVFPTENRVFQSIQLQGLSLYVLSTLASQLVMTLGGSRFPGAAGAMLMEILPFLRGVASDIQGVLGTDHLGLIPTVMAAYALTSLLTGAGFLLLGLLKIGALVAYFPQTVLTGAIGAIGVSLFILGLELPFPSGAPTLSLSNAASTLFATRHLGILSASFLPAIILSIALRARSVQIVTRGLVRSAYFIPVYLLTIPIVFWVTVQARGIPQKELTATGWLFTVEKTSDPSVLIAGWNYWALFDFKLVEWSALKSATQNIVLLVVIGILNLPIYVPTLAFSLDTSYDMNHELLGQGVANILAGVLGSVPNILQYSYSVYITRAKGGRFEMSLVCVFTIIIFFTTGLILPYIPTILASALVLFIGIELFLEAVWEAAKTLAWMEYAIVLGTLASCTALGFAEGFGVGIGAAAGVYLLYGVIDSPARVMRWNEWNEMQQFKEEETRDGHGEHVAMPVNGRLPSRQNHTPAPITLDGPPPQRASSESPKSTVLSADANLLQELNARVLVLPGYIFFASVPSIERALLPPTNPETTPPAFYILDLTSTHRIETAAARALPRCLRELEMSSSTSTLVICGTAQGTGLAADFKRAEVGLRFAKGSVLKDEEEEGEEGKGKSLGIPTFASREACLVWCRVEHEKRTQKALDLELDDEAKAGAYEKFCMLFEFDPPRVLGIAEGAPAGVQQFVDAGGRFTAYLPGQAIHGQGVAFLVEGQISLRLNEHWPSSQTNNTPLRPSVQALLSMLPRETLRAARAQLSALSLRPDHRHLAPGEVLDRGRLAVGKTRVVIVDVVGESGRLQEWTRERARVDEH
ncbi:sulfate transporter family-domain-containing protein [Mycena amicta]|nr:sulfate transporter family-domain-containing protein [Mycena amicta]